MKQIVLGIFLAASWAMCARNAGGAPGSARQATGLASQPPSQTETSSAAVVAGSISAAQVSSLRSLLQQIFMIAARASDLLGLIQPAQLKMTDAERAATDQQVTALRSQLRTLEKWRYAWFCSPGNPDYGQKAMDALGAVVRQLRAIQNAVSPSRTAPAAVSLGGPADDLNALREKLQRELSVLFPGRFAPTPPAAEASAPARRGPAAPAAPRAAATASHPASVAPARPSLPSSSAASVPSTAPVAVSPPVPSPPPLDPVQVKALLSKVYLASARINDLIGLVQPDKWKMNDADRALLQEKLSSLQSQMKALEQARYQLFYNPEDPSRAAQASAALSAAVPAIRVIAALVGQYGSATDAAQLNQPTADLAEAEGQLASYSAYLQQRIQQRLAARPAGLPGHVALETERIASSAAVTAPLNSVTIFTPPLKPGQVKAMLYKIYVSDFRIRDLLGQERPEQWKAPQAEQALANQAREALLSQIATLEAWRGRLNRDPRNMYYAFEVFRAVEEVFHPLRVFSREVARYQGASMGEPYRRRADDLEASVNALMPYVAAILQHASDNVTMVQADLDTCQNQLTYAMHGMLHAPTPLRNVVPVFQGRRARARRQAAKDKSAHP